jgi:MraZ protein
MSEFWGTYKSALDSKGRINIPIKLRKNLIPEDDNTFMLIRGEGKCIIMYPLSGWKTHYNSIKDKLGSGRNFKVYTAHYMQDSSLQTLDKQGRINLTKKLIDYADLDGEVEIHTHGDHISVWKEHNIQEYLGSTEPEAEKIKKENDLE